MLNEILTIQEVSQIYKISESTVRRWIAIGALPAIQLPGGRIYRIRREELDDTLRKTMVAGKAT